MLRELRAAEAEAVHAFADTATGLEAIIAIHSTRRGPAFGGCRIRAYPDEQAALEDALKLAQGMSYKNALAGIPFGGGKAVIVAPRDRCDRRALFNRFGGCLETLAGRYVTAMDAGATTADMDAIGTATRYVSGRSAHEGDPSPYTALGLAACIRDIAALEGSSVGGLRIAIQGVGHVGAALGKLLAADGAELIVADPDGERVARMVEEFGARAASVDAITEWPCDVFAPCAYGGVVDTITAHRLQCRFIVGAANNQLAARDSASRRDIIAALEARGIRYLPDYVVNAGGVIHAGLAWLGYARGEIHDRIERIPQTLESVLALASSEGLDVGSAADRLAEGVIQQGQHLGIGSPVDPRAAR